MTVLDHPERVKAVTRGDLAERLVDVAGELAFMVRDESREAIGAWLDERGFASDARTRALLVVVAAMVPDDKTADQLLAWVTFDEFGHLLPGTAPVLQQRAEPDDPDEPDGEHEPERRLTPRERNLLDFAELRDLGLSPEQAAVRLGMHPRTGWRYERVLRDAATGGEAAAA